MTTRRTCDGRPGPDGWTGCPDDASTGERLGFGWVNTWDREADMFRHSSPKRVGHTADAIECGEKRRRR